MPEKQQHETCCAYICQELRAEPYKDIERVVTRAEFIKKHPDSEWSRAAHGVCATLRAIGYNVTVESKAGGTSGQIILRGVWKELDSNTARFRMEDNEEAKEKIGEYVAKSFLNKTSLKPIFLGSGTTVCYIGRYIEGPDEERYSTISIPLAAEWCRRGGNEPKKITVLGGVLNTANSRYDGVLPTDEAPAIAVVGADGFRFDRRLERFLRR